MPSEPAMKSHFENAVESVVAKKVTSNTTWADDQALFRECNESIDYCTKKK